LETPAAKRLSATDPQGEMKLILASASPRRAQILRDAGLRFEIVRINVRESRKPGENARAMTRRLALAKARAAVARLSRHTPETIVIGADTTISVKGNILGKPQSSAAARKMLTKVSGRTHRVTTSVAAIRLPHHAERIVTETTRVRFAPLTTAEIQEYVSTGEPLDKAGAYGVQGIGGRYVEKIEGCYFNVVGLPLARIYRLLINLGWKPAATQTESKAAG
jgi:septum formation protein